MAGDAVELGATRATNIGDYEVTPPLVVVRIVLHFGIQQSGLPGCVDANGVRYFRNHRAGAVGKSRSGRGARRREEGPESVLGGDRVSAGCDSPGRVARARDRP